MRVFVPALARTLLQGERDRIVENNGSERQCMEASMMNSKAQLMAQTIDSGAINHVKEQLSLLAQIKESYIRVQDCDMGGKGEDDMIRPPMTCFRNCHF